MSEANYFNKIITNHAVDLTDDEIAVLSVTLGRIMSGGYADYKYWRPTIGADGNCTWELDRNIVDKPNPAKVVGTDGRTPVFSADPTNAHLVWAYADAVETSGWSDIPYALSGQKGDPGVKGNKGDPGAAGENGQTPELQVNENTELQWKYTDEAETEWRSLGLYASGNSGFSPTVTTTEIPTSQDSRGGYTLTFQYGPEGSQTQSVNIYNGTNGEGAQFTVSEGTGIQVSRNSDDFTVALNSDTQAALAQVPVLAAASADWNDVSAKLDKAIWDSTSGGFVTSAGLANDTWYLFTTSGWKPSDNVLTTVEHDNTLSGNGWDSSPLGLAQNVREITFSAGYADNAKYAEKVTDGTYEYELFPLINTFALNNSSYLTTIQHDATLSGTGHSISQLGIADNVNIPSFSAGYATSAYWAVKAKTNDGQHEYTIGTELASLNSIIQYLDGWAETAITGEQGVEVLDLDEDGYPETFRLTSAAYAAVQKVGTASGNWDDAYAVTEAYKTASGDFLKTVSTDNTTISGNGTSEHPLGILDVPVYVNSATNEIRKGTSAVSAVCYRANPNDSTMKPQRLYIAQSDNEIISIVQGGGCEGQGTLFFRIEGA